MKTDMMPKGHTHIKWKCMRGNFILKAWTYPNIRRFWTGHFHRQGVNFQFMYVSTRRKI